jgi:DMSO/TMAO reductase YedYZ molybdopterin-dependent catalytic subunit
VRSTTSIGWLVGLLSAAVAVGVGELVAAFFRPAAVPVIAVGNRIILLTPESAKRATINSVGGDDKLLLIGSIYLLLAVLGAAVGALAMRNLYAGLAGVAVIGAFGVYCALTAHAGRGSDAVPTVVGAIASAAVLAGLVRAAGGPTKAEVVEGVPNRRLFLLGSLATAALAAVAGFGGRAAQDSRFNVAAARRRITLPQAVGGDEPAAGAAFDLRRSGIPWATPNSDFYRVDTALVVPQIDPGSWRLRVYGMVEREITLTYAQLLARPLVERWITLCCVSNEVGGQLIGNARFLGARLADVLREAGIAPDADELLLTSYDGMTIGAPRAVVMDGRDSLLAVGMNGETLPVAHGFPVRTVVPGLYGYVSACKWIVDIEATTFARSAAYWVTQGYAAAPPIVLESRIDTPRPHATLRLGSRLAVAGVAWDQHVGVSKVEVQVDDGAWQAARLASVPSTDTWRQWVLPWTPQRSGEHRLRVRAIDSRGTPQVAQSRPPYPAGATGLHTITVRVAD